MSTASKQPDQLPFSQQQLAALLQTPAGKQMLQLLQRNPALLANAVAAWKAGDLSQLQTLLAPVLSAKEAEAFRKEMKRYE